MQPVACRDLLVRVQVEPSLTAFLGRARVPGDREGLKTPTIELDQVLLERIDSEDVRDFKIGDVTVRSFGLNDEGISAA
jgi:hypothetical protein